MCLTEFLTTISIYSWCYIIGIANLFFVMDGDEESSDIETQEMMEQEDSSFFLGSKKATEFEQQRQEVVSQQAF